MIHTPPQGYQHPFGGVQGESCVQDNTKTLFFFFTRSMFTPRIKPLALLCNKCSGTDLYQLLATVHLPPRHMTVRSAEHKGRACVEGSILTALSKSFLSETGLFYCECGVVRCTVPRCPVLEERRSKL